MGSFSKHPWRKIILPPPAAIVAMSHPPIHVGILSDLILYVQTQPLSGYLCHSPVMSSKYYFDVVIHYFLLLQCSYPFFCSGQWDLVRGDEG